MVKLLKYLKKEWLLVFVIFIFTCAQVALEFLMPVCMGEIISCIQGAKSGLTMDKIWPSAIWMLLCALGSGLLAVFNCLLASHITAKMMARVRYQIYEKVSSFSANEMNSFSISSLITRTTNDITNVSNTYVLIFRFLIYGPLLAIAALLFLIIGEVRYQLLCVIIASVLLIAIIIFIVVRVAIPHFNIMQKRIDAVNLVTKENLEGLRVIRAYNAENYQKEKFGENNNALTKDDRIANIALGVLNPAIQLVMGIMMVAITFVGALLIKDPKNNVNFADVTIVVQFSGLLLTGFILMVIIFVMIPRSTVCARRINEVINTETSIQYPEVSAPTKEIGTIEFKDVTFTYPNGGAPSLKNVTFKVNRGETIAFIGATGAGKTTLLNLIQRFYDTSSGTVLVDGVDVRNYRAEDLFQKFGYVPQKPYLFHDTLKNNVCLGAPNATNEEFEEALEISQASEFVYKLPGTGSYEISQGGKNVSGGQRQRLSIARAVIKKPEIFIFDDSFSALDYRTDRVVRESIRAKCHGVTNVIVAQRVGTIMNADQIVVLDNGNVMGIGKHRDLLKTCPVYREIALSQLSKEELENA